MLPSMPKFFNKYFRLVIKDSGLRSDIFSKGSWGTDFQFRFKKRYKFNSNFKFSYAEFIKGEEGEVDYWFSAIDVCAQPASVSASSRTAFGTEK